MFEALAGGITHLQCHHGAADPAHNLARNATGLGAAVQCRGPLLLEGTECRGQARPQM